MLRFQLKFNCATNKEVGNWAVTGIGLERPLALQVLDCILVEERWRQVQMPSRYINDVIRKIFAP